MKGNYTYCWVIIGYRRLIDAYTLIYWPMKLVLWMPFNRSVCWYKGGGMGSVDTKTMVASLELRLKKSFQWLPSPSLLQRYLLCVKVAASSWACILYLKHSGIFLPPILLITGSYVFTAVFGCSTVLPGLRRWWMLKHRPQNLPSTIKMTEEDYAVWMQNYITVILNFLLSRLRKSCLVLKRLKIWQFRNVIIKSQRLLF